MKINVYKEKSIKLKGLKENRDNLCRMAFILPGILAVFSLAIFILPLCCYFVRHAILANKLSNEELINPELRKIAEESA